VLLVLAHLPRGETFAELAAGFRRQHGHGLEVCAEAVALLAARASKLPAVTSTTTWCWMAACTYRPEHCRPAALLWHASLPRDEPVGHRRPGR
jgi:hypothetical protein